MGTIQLHGHAAFAFLIGYEIERYRRSTINYGDQQSAGVFTQGDTVPHLEASGNRITDNTKP